MCVVSEGVLHKKLVQAYLIAVIWLAWDTYPTAEVRLIKDTYPNVPIQDKYHLICQRGGIGCVPLGDLDLDLWLKITQITVHERNGVFDELSKNSKKGAILRVRSFGRIWIWICDQRWHRSQCIKGMEF